MSGPSNFDIELFKHELLKEIKDDTQQMIKDMVAKIVGKMLFNEEDSETRTVLGEPLEEKLKVPVDPIESEWMKDMKR